MTGFGYAETRDDRFSVAVEVKSYNHRFLDISANLPPHLGQLEPRVREVVGEWAERGRVEVFLRLTEFEEDISVTIDRRVAEVYKRSLDELVVDLGIEDSVGLSHLLRLDGVLKTERKRDADVYWQAIETPLNQALEDWAASRTAEGQSIEADLASLLDKIDESVVFIDSQRSVIETHIRDELRRRFQEMLGDGVGEERILAETALLLVKFDINEEIVRMRTHLLSFRGTMASEGPAGKKLDFLAQELGREINTIGSKSVNTDISSCVIEVKDSIEKIREQLRNAE